MYGGNFMDKIAVLIPCYNEEQTIKKVILDFLNILPDSTIYMYDNNSTDKTVDIVNSINSDRVIIRTESKQGKGNVVRSMFRDIDARCYIIVDGDDTYPAEIAPSMCDFILNKNYDMVIADRLTGTYFQENKRLFHSFGNKLVRHLINTLFNNNIHDIMTGYRAFSYDFVKMIPITSEGFEVETEMTINALDKNLKIKEIPIEFKERPEGSFSKLNTFRDGYRVLKTIVIMFKEYKPMIFFSLSSALCILCAIIFFIPILREYFITGLVPRFPTLIISTFLAILSSIFFAIGLILDVIVKKSKQDFIIRLNQTSFNRRESFNIIKEKDNVS